MDGAAGGSIAAQRLSSLENGYKPVPLGGPRARCNSPGKQPAMKGWQTTCETATPQAISAWDFDYDWATNTGILCAGLRIVDVDIDDLDPAQKVYVLAVRHLGRAPFRRRKGSTRFSLLYRAAEGEPRKRSVSGAKGKVEILGAGQQCVVFGVHASGGALYWSNGGPDTVPRNELPAVTEKQVGAFLAAVARVIGAKRESRESRAGGMARPESGRGFAADPDLVAAALERIPNDDAPDWEPYSNILMAAWNATEVKGAAKEDAREWSAKNPAHKDAVFEERWEHYSESPPDSIGAGTLFHLAREATGWTPRPTPTEDEIDDMLSETPGEAGEPRDRYPLHTPAECARAPSRGYIVKGLIAPGDVFSLFGPPGTGKSLLAPLIGYMVALGRPAFGRRARRGRVLYIAAEDFTGMCGRVTALRAAHGDTSEFLVMGGVGNLMDDGGPDLREVRAVVERHRPALILLDTVAMAFPGLKENEANEMGRVVAVARGLTKYGAAVGLIHHDTKARDGTPRGHGILNGALDMALCLDPRDANGIVRGRLTKNRNGPAADHLSFRIDTHDAGVDGDGDPIRLPLAVEVASDAGGGPRLARSERAALDVLLEVTALEGGPVPLSLWQAECERTRVVSDADKPASRAKAFRRAAKRLEDEGLIRTDGTRAGPTSLASPEVAADLFLDATTDP